MNNILNDENLKNMLEWEKENYETAYAFVCELFMTTYCDTIADKFGKELMEVMKIINDGKTFDYIKNNHEKYLYYVNILDFNDCIDWGTSIRGAWLNDKTLYARLIKIVNEW